jgi:hypothetical protein
MYSPALSGVSARPNSQILSYSMLVLPTVENCIKNDYWVHSSGIYFTPDFIKICPCVLELNNTNIQKNERPRRSLHSLSSYTACKGHKKKKFSSIFVRIFLPFISEQQENISS